MTQIDVCSFFLRVVGFVSQFILPRRHGSFQLPAWAEPDCSESWCPSRQEARLQSTKQATSLQCGFGSRSRLQQATGLVIGPGATYSRATTREGGGLMAGRGTSTRYEVHTTTIQGCHAVDAANLSAAPQCRPSSIGDSTAVAVPGVGWKRLGGPGSVVARPLPFRDVQRRAADWQRQTGREALKQEAISGGYRGASKSNGSLVFLIGLFLDMETNGPARPGPDRRRMAARHSNLDLTGPRH